MENDNRMIKDLSERTFMNNKYILFTLLFISIIIIGAYLTFERLAEHVEAKNLCSEKSTKPEEKFSHDTFSIAGYWFQFPEKRTRKIPFNNKYTECFERVYFGFSVEEITGGKMPANSGISVYVQSGQRSITALPSNQFSYVKEYDLTFYSNAETLLSTHLVGKLKNENINNLPSSVVFNCYNDPRESLFPTCRTVYNLNNDLAFSIRLDTPQLMYWREIYLHIFTYFNKTITPQIKEKLE